MQTATVNRSSKFEGSSQAQNSRITKNDLKNIYADFKSSDYYKKSKILNKNETKILDDIWKKQSSDADLEKQEIFLRKTIGKNQKNFNFSNQFINFAFDLQLAALLERRRAFCHKYSSGQHRFSVTPEFINSLNLFYSSLY